VPASRVDATAITPGGQRRLLPVLLAVFVVQQVDRNILNVMIEPLKHEFALSDGQLGLLAGTAFGAAYLVAGLPLGRLADRTNRRNLLAFLLGTWSLLTAASAFCQSYAFLVLSRFGLGTAESGTQPISMSMLSDVYPPGRRATVAGMIYGAAMFGGFVSFVGGGYVVAAYGWRTGFLIAGLPGLVLAACLMLFVREPMRTRDAGTDREGNGARGTFVADMMVLLRGPVLGPIYLATFLCVLVASATTAWGISLLMRYHAMPMRKAAIAIALASTLFGTIGPPLAGWLADRPAFRTQASKLLIPAATTAACCLGAWGFSASSVALAALAALCVMCLTTQAHSGIATATISHLAAPHSRALAFSLFSVVSSAGLALGPWLVGLLSDRLDSTKPLASAIALLAPLCLLAGGLFILAARRLGRIEGGSKAF